MTAFARRVLHLVRRIPSGRVVTYGDVARICGRPRAARAVGNILRDAPEPGLPYHRVIASAGRLGGFGGDSQRKALLLTAEGHVVRRGRVLEFEERRWKDSSQKPKAKSKFRTFCSRLLAFGFWLYELGKCTR